MKYQTIGAAIANAPHGGTSAPEYLTFTNVHETETAHISMEQATDAQKPSNPTIYFSKTKKDFVLWDYSAIELLPGESVYMYGDNPNGVNSIDEEGNICANQFVITEGSVSASGNVQTLRDAAAKKDSPLTETAFDFAYLFAGYTEDEKTNTLITAPELPATTLAPYCYSGMFAECTNLTAAPELPAKTLAGGCYGSMFYSCASLTAAPELPATTLAERCYEAMFYECTSLTAAPELPATTLAKGCYGSMFGECTSLTAAPELPASTLVESCYGNMFYACSSLTSVHVAFTEWPEDGISGWLSGVAESGTFTKPTALPEQRGENYIPEGWTIVNE